MSDGLIACIVFLSENETNYDDELRCRGVPYLWKRGHSGTRVLKSCAFIDAQLVTTRLHEAHRTNYRSVRVHFEGPIGIQHVRETSLFRAVCLMTGNQFRAPTEFNREM